MIIRFKRSKRLRGSSPKAPHNKERLKWIADSKEGRTLDEIKKHKEHYKNLNSDLNYDLHGQRIYIDIQDE